MSGALCWVLGGGKKKTCLSTVDGIGSWAKPKTTMRRRGTEHAFMLSAAWLWMLCGQLSGAPAIVTLQKWTVTWPESESSSSCVLLLSGYFVTARERKLRHLGETGIGMQNRWTVPFLFSLSFNSLNLILLVYTHKEKNLITLVYYLLLCNIKFSTWRCYHAKQLVMPR